MERKDNRRFDSRRRMLRTGEYEKKDGSYIYRWTDHTGKRHSFTARTLEELRRKEERNRVNTHDGIRVEAVNTTVNDIYNLWCVMKRGVKDNTFQNYKYMYEMFVEPDLGRMKVQFLKKSDVRRFYNTLIDQHGLKIATVDNVHTVLHQVLNVAVEDGYVRINPADNVLRELKKAHNLGDTHKRALTIPEQELLEDYLKSEERYRHWYPIFAVMLGTGMRAGEVTGLRWEDIDFNEGFIDVNHTLVYYNHAQNGCYFNVHTPKTRAGERRIPMLSSVREAFEEERNYQWRNGIQCDAVIDGYTGFVFVNRMGGVYNHATLNKAIRRITRDCNDAILNKNPEADLLLPRFSCHSLRHTFTTRMVEAGVNIKVVQEVLGHKDISTTLNIYADVTKELAKREFDALDKKLREGAET